MTLAGPSAKKYVPFPTGRNAESGTAYPVLDEVCWGVEDSPNAKVRWLGEYWVKDMPKEFELKKKPERHVPISFTGKYELGNGSLFKRCGTPRTGLSCGFGKAFDDLGLMRAEGIWNKGNFVFGNAFNGEGVKIYEGNYANAKRHGKGIEFSAETSLMVFDGSFYDGNRFHGTEYNAFSLKKS